MSYKPLSASEVTTIWRYTNVYIIIIIIIISVPSDFLALCKAGNEPHSNSH